MSVSTAALLTIIVLDKQALIREALEARLSRESDFQVVGVYACSAQLIEALRRSASDVLIVDYQLGEEDLDGVSLLQLLHNRYPHLRILIYSALEMPSTIKMALRAGASGYFGKSQATDQLIPAVRAVASGRRYLPPPLLAELNAFSGMAMSGLDMPKARTKSPMECPLLSPKEIEVIRCCLLGMSVSQIATKFMKSRKTISGQKQAAFRKLSIRTDIELFKMQASGVI
ncbi:response regulator transcription factor [Pseudomonas sp. Irchel 3E20]|uniref:response regulator transcription factor n=1 Tax=Pseudomonas sp. Irchel 3E20 TaxID=2008983 RepID=UPI000BA3D1A7|nr:response regulator transcription factor [Pseudomonas sp. Irchel 3E20]